MDKCIRCQSENIGLSEKKFSDGTTHIKKTCVECGQFLGWQKQGTTSFKDELIALARDLAYGNSGDLASFRVRAKILVSKIDPLR